jgi:prevent-host-death family protein
MGTEIGAFDAKTHLSRLLREVEQGRRYTITVRGRPVADLIPSERPGEGAARGAVEAMRGIGKVTGVAAQDIADWIAEGRR